MSVTVLMQLGTSQLMHESNPPGVTWLFSVDIGHSPQLDVFLLKSCFPSVTHSVAP